MSAVKESPGGPPSAAQGQGVPPASGVDGGTPVLSEEMLRRAELVRRLMRPLPLEDATGPDPDYFDSAQFVFTADRRIPVPESRDEIEDWSTAETTLGEDVLEPPVLTRQEVEEALTAGVDGARELDETLKAVFSVDPAHKVGG